MGGKEEEYVCMYVRGGTDSGSWNLQWAYESSLASLYVQPFGRALIEAVTSDCRCEGGLSSVGQEEKDEEEEDEEGTCSHEDKSSKLRLRWTLACLEQAEPPQHERRVLRGRRVLPRCATWGA